MMPDRDWSSESQYRFGFQGEVFDRDLNFLHFTHRIYDPRISRFISTDPLRNSLPYVTPYSFSQNRVIDAIELEGLELIDADQATVEFKYGALKIKVENTNGTYLRNNTNVAMRGGDPTVIVEYLTLEPAVTDVTSALSQPLKWNFYSESYQIRKTSRANSLGNTKSSPEKFTINYTKAGDLRSKKANATLAAIGLVEVATNQIIISRYANQVNEIREHIDLAYTALDLTVQSQKLLPRRFKQGEYIVDHYGAIASYVLSGVVPEIDDAQYLDAGFTSKEEYNTAIIQTGRLVLRASGIPIKEIEHVKIDYTGGDGLDGFKWNKAIIKE